jgi:electron transport complex protein RnfG
MATKLESTLKNMILSLLLISASMSAALGYVYVLTKEPIEKAAKEKEINAIKEVMPKTQGEIKFTTKEVYGLTFYEVVDSNNQPVGCAVKTFTTKGFSGKITLMVGLLPDGSINNISVLEQKETPGLGDKMKTKWKDQFTGKNPGQFKMKVKKDGGEVDAITAATITSRAFCDAVQKAYNAYMKGGKK